MQFLAVLNLLGAKIFVMGSRHTTQSWHHVFYSFGFVSCCSSPFRRPGLQSTCFRVQNSSPITSCRRLQAGAEGNHSLPVHCSRVDGLGFVYIV